MMQVMVSGDVLVVDDDRDGRDALSQLLAASGYTVRQAENGRLALDRIAERVPGFLVLDLEMPVMSGWEVLGSLRRAGALHAITVVVLSGWASPPAGVAFVRKPCEIDELLSALAASHPHEIDASQSGRHPQWPPAPAHDGRLR